MTCHVPRFLLLKSVWAVVISWLTNSVMVNAGNIVLMLSMSAGQVPEQQEVATRSMSI